RAFTYMWRYSENLRSLYETPSLAEGPELSESSRSGVQEIIHQARRSGRLFLNESESKAVLSHYGIPTGETRIARNEEEAVQHASELGFPVVLKIFSDTITHKTDVGGVKLNLEDEAAV